MIFVEYFLWLIVYSFIGWIYESIICSAGEKRLVNRGFLNGPVCPVYGFGALTCIFFLNQKIDNVALLFFLGMLLTCAVEYITSVLLEKLFNTKWWDYSNHRFNIQGRVSLLGAIVFGTFSVLLIKYVHPFIRELIGRLPDPVLITASLALSLILMLDLYVTVRHILLLNSRLQEIQAAINSFLEQRTKRAGEIKATLLNRFEESEFYNGRIKDLLRANLYQSTRLLRAFPKSRSVKYNEAWQKLKSILLDADDID